MIGRLLKYGSGVLGIALILAQFVQPDRTNPPFDRSATFAAAAEPSSEVAAAIGRACRDCHSNETAWPWYSRIAPASWLIARDVKEGRARLNFSQWNIYGPEVTRIKMGEMCDEVRKGSMPPPYYVPMHPETRLRPAEISAICVAPMDLRKNPSSPLTQTQNRHIFNLSRSYR